MNGPGTLDEGSLPGRCPVGEQLRSRTGFPKKMNVAVMECYFLSRPFDEEGKPMRGYRKQMHNIWKERHG